jgi:arylsulfatase A-like enzyme
MHEPADRKSSLWSGLLMCLLLATVTAGAQTPPRAQNTPPNLLLVTFDTTRADRLPAYGYRQALTPAIGRLAREGIVFSNAYAPAVQTLPSHASLLTGLYPITTNVMSNGQRLEPDALTLAEILQDAGYRTGAIVATAPLMEVFGLAQGFVTYDDEFEDSLIARSIKGIFRFFTSHRVNIRTTRPADRVAALSQQWLRKAARSGQPFFLWVHFIEPHSPYDRRRGFGSRARGGTVNAAYVSEIEFADHHLGLVLDELDDLGLTNRTLTVFTADHGESLGEDGYTGHRAEVFERIIRVPLIVRLPDGIRAGSRISTPAQLVDVAPTVLDLLHLQPPGAQFQGVNLLTFPAERPRKIVATAAEVLTRSPIRIAMIYRGRKYVRWPESGEQALYDLAKDPQEHRNLLASARRPAEHPMDWAGELREWWERNDRLRPTDFVPSREHLERLRSLGYIKH